MDRNIKRLVTLVIGASLFVFSYSGVAASILQGFQGGTGYGSASSSAVGNCLTVASTSPFLTYSLGTCGSSGGSTTTINGVQGPTFTFSIVGTSSPSSITTTTSQLFLNLLQYASGTDINVASNGTINFVNTPGFITTSTFNASTSIKTTAPLTGGGSITNGGTLTIACATCIATNTGNWAGTWQGYNHTDFLTSSTPHLDSYNISSANSYIGVTTTTTSAVLTFSTSSFGSNAFSSVAYLPLTGGTISGALTTNGISNTGNVTSTNGTFTSGLKLPFVTSTILATDANGNIVATTTSGGSSSVTSTYVAFGSNSNTIIGTSSFNYNNTSSRLTLGNVTSSLFIGTNANFSTSTVVATTTLTFNYTGSVATWTVPNTILGNPMFIAYGSAGQTGFTTSTDLGGAGGNGTIVKGTLTVSTGTTYYIFVASSTAGGAGGVGGNMGAGGNGGGFAWISTTSTFSTERFFS